MIKRYTVTSGASHFPFFFNEDPPTDKYGQQTMVLYTDHIAEVCKYRDKILELAKQCEPCGGTGMITVEPGFTAAFGRVVPCNACEDLRELTS